MKRLLGFFLSIFIFSASLIAAHERGSCDSALRSLHLIPSGVDDPAEFAELSNRVKIIQEVAQSLGVSLPPHMLEVAPGSQLMTLASLGRHAVRHWRDGSVVANEAWKAAGVLEFVTPGCPTCRSFYQNTTPLDWQTSIVAHVFGHNDFSAVSMFARVRNADPIAASLDLNDLLNKLYEKHDHDEVSQWYQYLLSLDNLQDLARSTFENPSQFDLKTNSESELTRVVHARDKKDPNKNSYPQSKHPRVATPSVLQFLVHNLPSDIAAWKQEMLAKFEEMSRVTGFYASNKFMNEGWAVTFQEILVRHTPYTEDEHLFNYHDLMVGVAGRRDLGNPYWLGREAWKRVRARFDQQEGIKALSVFEADKAFIAYAHDNIINHMNDFDFLRMALDEHWVHENNAFLYRPAQEHEKVQVNLPPNAPVEQKIVTSTAAEKVVMEIARSLVDRRFQIPRILVKNSDGFGRGVLELEHEMVRDPSWPEDIEGIPLQPMGLGLSMYVMSKIMKKPVSINTVFLEKKDPNAELSDEEASAVEEAVDRFLNGGGWSLSGGKKQGPEYYTQRARLEVNRDGKVSLYEKREVDGKLVEILDQASSNALEALIREYEADLALSVNDDLYRHDRELLVPMVNQVLKAAPSGNPAMLSHAPTASGAVQEYYSLLQKRLAASMAKVFAGKLAATPTASGVKVRAMPIIPQIGFDHSGLKKIMGSARPAPVDSQLSSLKKSDLQDDVSSLPTWALMGIEVGMGKRGADGRKKPGDIFLGQAPGKGNGGESDEEDEGEESDEELEPSNKPGEEGGDPSLVEIPMEVFQEFLMQELELPNLKPKEEGDTFVDDEFFEGGKNAESEHVLYERMMPQILALGTEALKKKGIDPKSVPPQRLLREGFRLMSPQDLVVRDRIIEPAPKAKAVVVMMIDMSGSMEGWALEVTRRFVFNLKLALESKYEGIEFRFVAMDTKTLVFDDLNKFIKTNLGGGTNYTVGFEKSLEVFSDFPADEWDRYYFALGDSQDWGEAKAIPVLNQIIDSIEFTGYVHLDVFPGYESKFRDAVRAALESAEFGAFADVKEGPGAEFVALKQLFGKEK